MTMFAFIMCVSACRMESDLMPDVSEDLHTLAKLCLVQYEVPDGYSLAINQQPFPEGKEEFCGWGPNELRTSFISNKGCADEVSIPSFSVQRITELNTADDEYACAQMEEYNLKLDIADAPVGSSERALAFYQGRQRLAALQSNESHSSAFVKFSRDQAFGIDSRIRLAGQKLGYPIAAVFYDIGEEEGSAEILFNDEWSPWGSKTCEALKNLVLDDYSVDEWHCAPKH